MHFGVFVKRRPSALSEIQTNENPNDLLRYTKVQNTKTLKSEIRQKIQKKVNPIAQSAMNPLPYQKFCQCNV